jgi:beta-lactamase regulating signal transducer with metallopeptidase domain
MLFWWLAQNAVLSGLLAAAVALACRVGRFRPAVRHALWLIVLLKLVTPPIVGYPGIELAFAAPLPEAESPSYMPEPATFQILAPVPQDAIVALAPAEPMPANEQPDAPTEPLPVSADAPSKEEPRLHDWIAPFAARVFLLGAAGMLLMHLFGVIRLRRLCLSGTSAPAELVTEVRELAAMLGVRPPVVRSLPNIGSPFVWGLWAPVLLWPAELSRSLSSARQRAVLIHELAHLRRRDHWVAWLRALAGCVWWWNPVYWIVSRQLGRNAELACDAWVIAALPDARRDYAEALLAVAGCLSRTATLAPAVGMSGSRRDFERRLIMVMRESVPCRMPVLGLVAVGVLALAVLPGLTLSQQGQKPAKITKSEEPTQSAPTEGQPRYINEGNFTLFTSSQAAPAQGDETDRKIKELEDKLQTILKEVKSLRESKGTGQATTKPKITEKPATATRPNVENRYWQAVEVQPSQFDVTYTNLVAPSNENAITLTRASYKLPKEKADALAAFLKHIRASVLETKVEDESLTVTTTPDVQQTIAHLVGLLTGRQHAAKAGWNLSTTYSSVATEPTKVPVKTSGQPAVKLPPEKQRQ